MDSPLILCNIQKCALEQVQAAVEQFGRSDTKHFYILQEERVRLFVSKPGKSEKKVAIPLSLR